jgi:hypothetical protein
MTVDAMSVAGVLSTFLDFPGVAEAAEGAANAAITAMSATIPERRLVTSLFAISTSLSRKAL